MQAKLDDGLQLFFSESLNQTHTNRRVNISDFSSALRMAGISNSTRLSVIPKKKNLVHIRLENLHVEHTDNVNLTMIANAFWQSANDKIAYKVEFTEMSLTGNMPLEEMISTKRHWYTVDDE